jgi:hypothetical protein
MHGTSRAAASAMLKKPLSLKAALQRDLSAMSGTRESLRKQLEVARSTITDDWKMLETKWTRVEAEIERAGAHTAASIGDIGKAARVLLADLEHGYKRIKAQLAADSSKGNGNLEASEAMVAEGAPVVAAQESVAPSDQ